MAPKMQIKLSAVGLHTTHTEQPSMVTEMTGKGAKSGKVFVPPAELASTEVVKPDVPKLPMLRRVSKMTFSGIMLAGVSQAR